MPKTQLAQGANRPRGKAARREAASLPLDADRRVSKLRPGCMSAMPQTCRAGRNARRTSTSLPRTRPTMRTVPGVQRPRRSTSDARQVSNREKDQRQTSTAGQDRGRRTNVKLRRFGPRWLRRTNVNSAVASIPSWAKPVQQGSRTQISKVGNLEKPTARLLLPRRKPGVKSFATQPPKSFSLVTENFNESSLKAPRACLTRLLAPETERDLVQNLGLLPLSPRVGES